MNYYIILAALLISFLCSFVFTAIFQGSKPSRQFFLLFLVIFFISWSGQLWITPFGPAMWGISFLPLLFIVLIPLLIMGAYSPTSKRKNTTPESESVSGIAIGIFFWALLILLITSVIVGYYKMPPIIDGMK